MNNDLKPQDYLPHEAPMVMLETVHQMTPDHVICSVRVSDRGVLAPFLDQQGDLPAWFGLEIMAQTVGVSSGAQAASSPSTDAQPAMGMLLGTQAYKTITPGFKSGTLLICEAKLLQRSGQLSSFECSLKDGAQELASARVNTWQADTAHDTPDQPQG